MLCWGFSTGVWLRSGCAGVSAPVSGCGLGCAGVSAPVSGLQDTRQVHPCSSPSASCLGRSCKPDTGTETHASWRSHPFRGPTRDRKRDTCSMRHLWSTDRCGRIGSLASVDVYSERGVLCGGKFEHAGDLVCTGGGVRWAGPSEAWMPRASGRDASSACPAHRTPLPVHPEPRRCSNIRPRCPYTHNNGDVPKDLCATHGARRDSVVGIGRCLLRTWWSVSVGSSYTRVIWCVRAAGFGGQDRPRQEAEGELHGCTCRVSCPPNPVARTPRTTAMFNPTPAMFFVARRLTAHRHGLDRWHSGACHAAGGSVLTFGGDRGESR